MYIVHWHNTEQHSTEANGHRKKRVFFLLKCFTYVY